ncbi:MAG TPA: M56 family metallopeptidase, partial [Candidatus Saccharimonadia bacterium]|nr:M56 family metallopeptidase [Candidatus Saccharimonadia bacterium]
MSFVIVPQAVEWVSALGWTLLHFLWQGALVGAAYGIARIALSHSRPQSRYALGLGALALLAALPVLTLLYLAPISAAGAAGAASAPVALGTIDAASRAVVPGFSVEPWLPWLVGAWLLGVVGCALRALLQYLRMRRVCRLGAEPLPEWDGRLLALCRRFGVTRPVRLLRSAIVQTPSLFGWIAPVIVLPVSVLVGLTPQQVELVIAHELGHVRRWDYAVNLLQIVVETVLFYHPVVHWISREVRNEREACCDDLVLRLGGDPVDYAQALAGLEELRGMTHAPALAASGGHLLGRIRRIVGAEPRFGAPAFGAQAVLVAALAFAAVMSVKPVARDVLNLAAVGGADATHPGAATPVELAARVATLAVERAFEPAAVPSAPAPSTATTISEPATVSPDARPAAPIAPPRIELALALPAATRPLAAERAPVGDLAFARPALAAPAVAAPSLRLEALAI